jgi:hypothetical protein
MTEREWLLGTDPAPMFNLLDADVGDRKLRLFAAACCRGIWHLIPQPERARVEVAERVADGLASRNDLCPPYVSPVSYPGARGKGAQAATAAASAHAWWGARRARAFAVDAARACGGPVGRAAEWRRQADLLRCLFGNPYRTPEPRPFPPEIVALARGCYDGDRELYPILADELDEIGEARAAAHCRQPVHAKGCHVLDWILGKDEAAADERDLAGTAAP